MKHLALWLVPILIFIAIAPFTPAIDMAIEQHYYADDFIGNPFYQFMYQYGFFPAWIAAACALVALFWIPQWRKTAQTYLLVFAVGSGLIVHFFFKEHWERPRPKQVIEFGGTEEYRPFWKPDFTAHPEKRRSFTCGHCSVGFVFSAAALAALREGRRRRALFFFLFTIILGVSLSLARMAQGAHFFSDTLASALIMWLTAVTAVHFIYKERPLCKG